MRVFDILKYISEHVTLVEFVDAVEDVQDTVSIYGCWIYD